TALEGSSNFSPGRRCITTSGESAVAVELIGKNPAAVSRRGSRSTNGCSRPSPTFSPLGPWWAMADAEVVSWADAVLGRRSARTAAPANITRAFTYEVPSICPALERGAHRRRPGDHHTRLL